MAGLVWRLTLCCGLLGLHLAAGQNRGKPARPDRPANHWVAAPLTPIIGVTRNFSLD